MQDFARTMEGQLILRSRLDINTLLKSGVTLQGNVERTTRHANQATVLRHANTLYDQILAFALAMNSSLGEIRTDIDDSLRNIVDITPAKKLGMLSLQMTSISNANAL